MPSASSARAKGGIIPIWRGRAGTPLREIGEGEDLVLTEGIEDALSVASACPDKRVLAAISIGNMIALRLPEKARRIILCADNDAPGSPAAAFLDRATEHFLAQGRDVLLARPPAGRKDFNDLLLRGAA